jgi:GTP-binding protein EngB required for normal cell division
MMDLRDYEHAKFELADLLRRASLRVESLASGDRARFQELFARLAEDRFNLVIAGRFSRGKSSLMNALLGSDRLPVGILPLTSVITTVAYGSSELAVIHYLDRRLPDEVPLTAIREYVTQEGNPGNVRRVRCAEIRLPAEILRRGFHFVDTPGLGSPNPENTRTTETFLPEADALVLVTSYDGPLSGEELQVLRFASDSTRRVFVVVNKHDLASAAERAQALRYVRDQVSSLPFAAPTQVFSVSARDALTAMPAGDATALAESGIPALEGALLHFLLADKRTEFLRRMCDRVETLLREQPRSTGSGALADCAHTLARRLTLDAADQRLHVDPAPPAVGGPSAAGEFHRCEVCEKVVRASFDFLRRYQYDLGASDDIRRQHASRGGLCPSHTWQYALLASPHGIATGYPPLLDRWARWLRAAMASASAPDTTAAMQALFPTNQTCALCVAHSEAEQRAVASAAQRVNAQSDAGTQLQPALCLPHLRIVLASIDDRAARGRLLASAAHVVERLSEDMRRYAIKHDGLRRALATDEEVYAAERSLAVLCGARALASPPAAA